MNSTGKHTPGPWKAVEAPYNLDARNANARLMAAAPELLAAVEQLRDMLAEAHEDEVNNGHGDDDGPCSYCDAIAEADKAIAKATGSDSEAK